MFPIVIAAQLAASVSQALAAPTQLDNNGGALQGVDTPTGNPANCTTPTKFFRQLTTHDHPAPYAPDIAADLPPGDTFLQQYQLVDDYFQPGGPILFFQGAEDPLLCAEGLAIYQYAADLGALVVNIEHRFFGLSSPGNSSYDNQLDWPTSALASLTLGNVMMDSVSLLAWIKRTVPGAEHSKVITFGGSYGGFLAAAERMNHPDTFFGAIATSAVTKGIISDPTDPLVYGIGSWISQAVSDASANAAHKIRNAFAEMRLRFANNDLDGLKDALSLCTQPDSSSQADTFLRSIAAAYYQVMQFDNALARPPRPFSSLINGTLEVDGEWASSQSCAEIPDDTLKILGVATGLSNALAHRPCLDWDTDSKRTNKAVPFQYAICTYFPYPSTIYTTADSIFGPLLPNLSSPRLGDADCQKAFGIDSFPGGEQYQHSLHLDQTSLETSQRIFFWQGTHDPVTPLGPTPLWPQSNKEQSRTFITTAGAHGAELLAPVALDSRAMNESRLAELNGIKAWLGSDSVPEVYSALLTGAAVDTVPGIGEEIRAAIGGDTMR